MDWFDNYNEEGLFFCPAVSKLPEKQREVLEPQGIFSMLHCAIKERGEFKGYIGFDNCEDHLIGWETDKDAIDALVFASRLLSLFLLENRNKSRLLEMVKQEEEKKQAMQAALDEAVRGKQIISRVVGTDYDYIMVVDIATERYQIYSNETVLSMATVPDQGDYSQMIHIYAEKYVVPEDYTIATDQIEIEYICCQLKKTPVYDLQVRVIEASGTKTYKRIKVSYLDKQHTKLLFSRIDITDLLRIEEEKRNSLENALAQAQAATKAKTDFLARMSHDIRTPMNAIIGLTALSLDEESLSLPLKENLTNIHSSGEFLLGLVNDILDMSKIEAGAVKLKKEPYSYKDFLAKLKAMFEPQCQGKNITFAFEDETLSMRILADKLRMDQIFFNILSNAVKFTPEGGRIFYSTANIRIDGKTMSSDFIIEDNGIGMSQAFMSRLFQPFEQEDMRYSSNLKGTGLGLTIAKSLTELMGGTLKVESKEGIGTRVTVHLGFALCEDEQQRETEVEEDDLQNEVILNGKHILLVEDHPLNAQIAQKLLEKKGMVVTHAENGKIAVDHFRTSHEAFYDAILMDIRMPLMDGLEATGIIRDLNRIDAVTVPIIAMSANAYEEDVRKSMEAGMDEHLAKPVEPDILYKTLIRQLTRREKGR